MDSKTRPGKNLTTEMSTGEEMTDDVKAQLTHMQDELISKNVEVERVKMLIREANAEVVGFREWLTRRQLESQAFSNS